jgi:glycosyltransferase involved in cell wall biosynthesis
MIEALACGTPVVALRRGSIPEVITHGVTGFVVDSLDEAVEATLQAGELSRERCRLEFVERFSAPRMAADYLALYERMTAGSPRDWIDGAGAPFPPPADPTSRDQGGVPAA